MCNRNKKIRMNDTSIADFDAVSLYQSAMVRINEELGGYLKGKPKVLKDNELNMSFLNSIDSYFIEIEVLENNVDRDFPLLSTYEGVSRNFTNEIQNTLFYIDKIALEDVIKFHKIKFRITRGYYFNEGRNNRIGVVMRNIFNARLEMKKKTNPAQIIYKLLMNSAYGKTILKPIKEDSRIMSGKTPEITTAKVLKYVRINYNHIKEVIKITDYLYDIKMIKPIIEHFNRVHIGVEILSMSKRIMNEVMCCLVNA